MRTIALVVLTLSLMTACCYSNCDSKAATSPAPTGVRFAQWIGATGVLAAEQSAVHEEWFVRPPSGVPVGLGEIPEDVYISRPRGARGMITYRELRENYEGRMVTIMALTNFEYGPDDRIVRPLRTTELVILLHPKRD